MNTSEITRKITKNNTLKPDDFRSFNLDSDLPEEGKNLISELDQYHPERFDKLNFKVTPKGPKYAKVNLKAKRRKNQGHFITTQNRPYTARVGKPWKHRKSQMSSTHLKQNIRKIVK